MEGNAQSLNGFTLPHTIRNKKGEELTFVRLEVGPNGDRLIVENRVAPGAGPIMHTHWQQDEHLEVAEGQIGYQVLGQAERFAGPGEGISFKAGTPHRFWNAGSETLICRGYIEPPHSIVYFLDGIYRALDAGDGERPEPFQSSRLMLRYRSEYDMPELPAFVKRIIMPLTVAVGHLMGKYRGLPKGPAPLAPLQHGKAHAQ